MKPSVNQPNHSSLEMARPSGMECPGCREFLPIGIDQLLLGGAIVCPHCGLSLSVDRSQSQAAIEALERVQKAIKQVRNTEKFRG